MTSPLQFADGSVRPDLEPADILLLMGFLWRVSPDDDGRDQGRRVMQIVFDGIRRNPTRQELSRPGTD